MLVALLLKGVPHVTSKSRGSAMPFALELHFFEDVHTVHAILMFVTWC